MIFMKNIKRRSESFFGMHSDFHAKLTDNLVIGGTLKEEDIREYLETLKPDFIQIDCKGHPGWASYPTAFNNRLPEYNGDPLRLWRDITKEYGVALYMHYSGVYETKYCTENPGQATVNKDGETSKVVRLDGDYFKDLFIPQICELVEKYEIDGIWIDGDCWSVEIDYRDEAIKRFEEKTGIELNGILPKSKEDKYYKELLDFTRDEFRGILKWYVDELHSKYPDLQICSNWAFTDHMPGKVCANVDFLSGDLMPYNCINSARYAGRALAQQNMPWDLMSWGFRFGVYKTPLIPPKSIIQIIQEAASVIALGGAYQDNISQFVDGSPDIGQIRKAKPLADFLRAREVYCFKGKAIHQAALLLSTYDREYEMQTPFDRSGVGKLIGLTALLCDSGESLEIVSEHTLKEHYSDYPMIIVPELYYGLSDDTVNELKEYVINGGSLMIIGTSTCRLFSEKGFGFDAEGYTIAPETPNWADHIVGHDTGELVRSMPSYFNLNNDEIGVTDGGYRITVDNKEQKVFANLISSLRGNNATPFVVTYPFGNGKVCVVGTDIGTQYNEGRQYLFRKLIKNVSYEMYEHMVMVEKALGILEVVCLEKEGKLYIQLLNANGTHTDASMVTEDYLSPVLDIRLSISANIKPDKLILQPDGMELPFTYENGRIYVDINRVDIHSIIEVI